jgi:hypothetical protein
MVIAVGPSTGINHLALAGIFSGERRSVFKLFRRQSDNVEGDHEFLDGPDFRIFA